jgi:hypothetical protein
MGQNVHSLLDCLDDINIDPDKLHEHHFPSLCVRCLPANHVSSNNMQSHFRVVRHIE